MTAYLGRPQPPRGLRCTSGSMEAAVFWNAPADIRGVDGFRVYKADDNSLLFETKNPSVRSTTLKLAAEETTLVYVSSVSRTGRESVRMPLIVTSNSDKYVASGTSGETSGTSAASPSEWSYEDYTVRDQYGQVYRGGSV